MKKYFNLLNKKNFARLGMLFLLPCELSFILIQFTIAKFIGEEKAKNKFMNYVENVLYKIDLFLEYYIHEGKKSLLRQEGENLNLMIKELNKKQILH